MGGCNLSGFPLLADQLQGSRNALCPVSFASAFEADVVLVIHGLQCPESVYIVVHFAIFARSIPRTPTGNVYVLQILSG